MRRRHPLPLNIPRPWIYRLADSVPDDQAHEFNGVRGRGSGPGITRSEIMEHFDSLPPELRSALANANHPWAPSWGIIVTKFGKWPLDAVIERLIKADREEEYLRELELLHGQG